MTTILTISLILIITTCNALFEHDSERSDCINNLNCKTRKETGRSPEYKLISALRGIKVDVASLDASVCGRSPLSENDVKRIVGGTEALHHSWSWMVSIVVNGHHVCGGSLIDQQWVLTAAHCESHMFHGDIYILLGAHDLSKPETQRISVGVHWTIPHEHFDHRTYNNDVMLLKLNEKVEFSSSISPACLPHHKMEFTPDDICYVVGWGRIEEQGDMPSTLQEVQIPIIPRDVCNRQSWLAGSISSGMICAGLEEGGIDACQMDSGGPLSCKRDGRWFVAGVVSWGAGCAIEKKPGVYAKISKYSPWIKKTIAENK